MIGAKKSIRKRLNLDYCQERTLQGSNLYESSKKELDKE